MKSKLLLGLIVLLSSCLDVQPVSLTEQLAKDVKKIDDYLAANPPAPTDILIQDATGIRVVITEMGTGTIPPNSGNDLKVKYTGRLFSDGSVFDSNTIDGYIFKLSDNIISGWKIGLTFLTQGTKAKLYIPSGWAYGTNGSGSTIPPNAILVFDIDLVSVVPTQQQVDKLQADVEAIDAYLVTNQVTAQTHPSGLRYVVTQEGLGAVPTLYEKVKLKYKAKLLTNDFVVIDQTVEPSDAFSSMVANYPHAVLLTLQLLHEGGKVTIYAPSTLAFGPTAYTGIPANSNIIFEIELTEVVN